MERSPLHKKVEIVIAVVEIIDELGLQGLSTREIAKRLGVSEGTLFRHYRSKNEILLAVLDHFSQYDLDISQSTKINKLKPLDSIRFWIKSYAEYYENYPAITAITQIYEAFRCDPELKHKIVNIFNNRYLFIKETIEEAQRVGEIRSEVDSEGLADIINSIFQFNCLKWRMKKNNFSLKERILFTLEMVLEAFATK